MRNNFLRRWIALGGSWLPPLMALGLFLQAWRILRPSLSCSVEALSQSALFEPQARSLPAMAGPQAVGVRAASITKFIAERFPQVAAGLRDGERARYERSTALKGYRPLSGPVGPRFFLPERYGALDIRSGDYSVVMTPILQRPSKAVIEPAGVVYPEAYAATDVLYVSRPAELEKLLLIKTKPASSPSFEFVLKGNDRVQGFRQQEGSIVVVDYNGRSVLRLSQAVAFDSAGKSVTGRYDLRQLPGSNSWMAKLTIDDAGLTYPVLIDPSWTSGPSMVAARLQHTATLLSNGKVLVAGGTTNANIGTGLVGSTLNTSEIYDPVIGTWTPTSGTMVIGRHVHTAVLLNNGTVLVAGGVDMNGTFLSSSEIFNPSNGQWTATTGSMTAPRWEHSAVLLQNGKALVAGGQNSAGTALASSEIYDPGTGQWAATTGSMSKGRRNFSMVLLSNGKVLVAGGFDGNGSAIATSEIYDPSVGTWSGVGSMAVGRAYSSAVLLGNGNVLMTGGIGTNTTGSALATSEIYNVGGGTWGTSAPLAVAREGHSSFLMGDGTVLVVGGASWLYDGSGYNTSEIYNPSLGTSALTSNNTTNRVYPADVALSNEKILVTGGSNGLVPLQSTEFYAFSPVSVINPIIGTQVAFPPIFGTASDVVSVSSVNVSISSGPGFSTSWNGNAWVPGPVYLAANHQGSPSFANWSFGQVPDPENLVPGMQYRVQSQAVNQGGVQEIPGVGVTFTYAPAILGFPSSLAGSTITVLNPNTWNTFGSVIATSFAGPAAGAGPPYTYVLFLSTPGNFNSPNQAGLVKYDKTGVFISSAGPLGDDANSIVTDNAGNVYVAESNCAGILCHASGNSNAVWIDKFSPALNRLSSATLTAGNFNGSGYLTYDGTNLYFASDGGQVNPNTRLLKLDTNLNILATAVYNGDGVTYFNGGSITPDSFGNLYRLTSNNSGTILLKYQSAGLAPDLTNPSKIITSYVPLNLSGNAFITAVGANEFVAYSSNTSIFVEKFDSNLNFVASSQIPAASSSLGFQASISSGPDGNLYVFGTAPTSDYLVEKLDPNLNFISSATFHSPNGGSVGSMGAVLSPTSVVMTGGSGNSINNAVTVSLGLGAGASGVAAITGAPYTGVGQSSFTANWTSTLAPGATAQLGTTPCPIASPIQSSVTLNNFATFTGLNPSTLYYVQVTTNVGLGPYYCLGSIQTGVASGSLGYSGLAWDKSSNLWAADSKLDTVKQFRSPSGVLTDASPGSFSLGSSNGVLAPKSIGVDTGGNVWVALASSPYASAGTLDGPQRNFIARYANLGGGLYSSSSSPVLTANVNGVVGIAFRSDTGDMWVANRYAFGSQPTIIEYPATPPVSNPTFTSTNVVVFANTAQVYQPRNIAFDSANNLWVALSSGIVEMFANSNPGGTGGTISNTPTIISTNIVNPLAMAFDSNNNLFLSSANPVGASGAGSLWKFQNVGTFGSPQYAAPTLLTSNSDIAGLAFDPSGNGNLWAADVTQSQIQVINTAPPAQYGVISGTVSYVGTLPGAGANFFVVASTNPSFNNNPTSFNMGVSSGFYSFSGLQAGSTYYIVAFRDSQGAFTHGPQTWDPVGMYTLAGSTETMAPVYVSANSTTTNINVRLFDVAVVTGTITNNSSETSNNIIVQAWHGIPNPNNTLQAMPGSKVKLANTGQGAYQYQLYVATTSDLGIQAFIDTNGDQTWEVGKDSGGPPNVLTNVLTPGTTYLANFAIGGGSAGTLFVQAVNFAPSSLPTTVNNQPMLRLGLWTQGGNAQMNSLTATLQGTIPSSQVSGSVYQDSVGDGVFRQGSDVYLGNLSFSGSAPPVAAVTFTTQTLTSTTQYYFIAINYYNVAAGKSVGISVDNTSRIGLLFGSVNPQGFPLQSILSVLQLSVYANPNGASPYPVPTANPPSGGFDTGLFVNGGQSIAMSAAGTWSTGQYPPTDANGVAGVLGGLLPGSNLGSLVGRIGGGNWFFVGNSSTFTASAGGELFVAMNDTATSITSGNLTLSPQILVSTATKVWLGSSGVNFNASLAANWQGGVGPVAGDNIRIDGSNPVIWDLGGAQLTTLTLSRTFTSTMTLWGPVNQGDYNQLSVTSNVYVDGGMLSLGTSFGGFCNKSLVVQGQLYIRGGIVDMGTSGNNCLEVNGVTASSGTFQSLGYSYSFYVESLNNYSLAPFTVVNATMNVNTLGNGIETVFQNISGVNIGPSAGITAFNNAHWMDFTTNWNSSLVLNYPSKTAQTFQGLKFDMNISSNANVDATGVAAGSTITILNASSGRMGSVFDKDPNHVVVWNPDGGAITTASGTLSYPGGLGSGPYWIEASTSPVPTFIGNTGAGGQACAVPQSGIGASFGCYEINTTSGVYVMPNLPSPNTYYFFAWEGTNGGSPGGFNPRGGYGNPALMVSNPFFIPSTGSVGGINIAIGDWGIIQGTVTNTSSQAGNIIVQVTQYGSTSTLRSPTSTIFGPGGGYYVIPAPPGAAQVFAFVDVNNNGMKDPFEAYGSSQVAPSTSPVVGDAIINSALTITGGSTPPGGTLSISSFTLAPYIGDFSPQQVIKLVLKNIDPSNPVTLNSIRVDVVGAVPRSSYNLWLYKDTNPNGVLDVWPFTNGLNDTSIAYQGMSPGVSSATLVIYNPETFGPNQSNTYFLALDLMQSNGHSLLPSVGLSVSATYFALSAGGMDPTQVSSFPIAALAPVYTQVMANTPAYAPSGGGFYNGVVPFFPGQQVTFTVKGTWQVNPAIYAGAVGPGGAPGTQGYNTIAPGLNVGELIGSFCGQPWVAVGTGTTLSVPSYCPAAGGFLSMAMNSIPGDYNNGAGVVDFNYSFGLGASTTGAISGQVLYVGTATAAQLIVNADQVPSFCKTIGPAAGPGCSPPFPVTNSTSIPLIGGTTYYPYVINGLPPGQYAVDARISNNSSQIGNSIFTYPLTFGTTVTNVNFPLSLGLGSLQGTLSYPTTGFTQYGNFLIGVSTKTDFQHNVVLVGGASLPSAGAFTIANLPTPATYYIIAFRDGNSDGQPDGSEPIGIIGNNNLPISNLATAFSPVFLDTGSNQGLINGVVQALNIPLSDKGGIFGNITSAVPLTSTPIVVVAGHGNPGTPNYVPENAIFLNNVSIQPGASFAFQIGLLRPATDYSILAFVDSDNNGVLDPGELFGLVPAPIGVPQGGFANVSLSFAGPQPPPPVTGFFGAPVAGTTNKIQWSWNSSPGATGYFLLNATNVPIYTVSGPNTTYYMETLGGPNVVSQVAAIDAQNAQGLSVPVKGSASVATLAAAPSGVSVSAYQSSATVTWSANSNSTGTLYNVARATSAANQVFYAIASTAAVTATPSFADVGLLPSSYYAYEVQAANFNNSTTSFSAAGAGTTNAATGPSIFGALTYNGTEHGPFVVIAATYSVGGWGIGSPSIAPLAKVVLPSATSYYLPVPQAGNYFVQAFVDPVGNGSSNFFFQGEDFGDFPSTAVYSPASVGPVVVPNGSTNNINITLVSGPQVQGLTMSSPFGLTAQVGFNQVVLNWISGGASDGVAGFQVQRATVPLPGTLPVFYNLVNAVSYGVQGVTLSNSFTDFAPIGGVSNLYRVVGVDYAGIQTPPSATVSVQPNVGDTVSGTFKYVGSLPSGQFHVRLSSNPSSSAQYVFESVSSGPLSGFFQFTGLTDGTYFLTVFRDTHTDNTLHPDDPFGTFGGMVQPSPIPLFGGSTAKNNNVTVCDRTKITPSATLYSGNLAATGCVALDQGSNFYTNVYTFQVGDGSVGSIGLGSNVQITLAPTFSPGQLFLLDPNGNIAASASGYPNATVSYMVTQPGTWTIEPTSFNPGVTGGYQLGLNVGGAGVGGCTNGCGFSGKISGTITYNGNQQGPVQVQLLPNSTPGSFPISVTSVTLSGGAPPYTGSYQFPNLPDGVYYVSAYRDSYTSGVQSPNDASGGYGISASSLSAININGGIATANPANILLTDPVLGAVKGAIVRQGTQTGTIRVEIGQPPRGCSGCSINVVAAATMSAAGQFFLPFLAPATNYTLRSYVDLYGSGQPQPFEGYASSTPVTVQALSTTTVNLIVTDPGFGASGDSVISGSITYTGVTTGTIYVAITVDPQFKTITYFQTLSSSGSFTKSGVLGGTSYYIAAFIDAQGTGQPAYQGTFEDPIGIYGGSSSNATPVFISPSSSSGGIVVPILDPPNGSIVGQVTYAGAAPGNIVVQAYVPNQNNASRGYYQTVTIPRTSNTVYNFTLPYLAASSSFSISAFVDSVGNGQQIFGDPFGQFGGSFCSGNGPCYGQVISVSSGAAGTVFPVYGVNFQITDPGALGNSAATSGQVSGDIAYVGNQNGSFVVRFFSTSTYSGTPAYTVVVPGVHGSGEYHFSQNGIAFGTYWADAFLDVNLSGVYNPTFDAYGTLNGGRSVVLSQYQNFGYVFSGSLPIVDPGQGGSVNAFTGSFASLSGLRFDGGATDIAASIAVDTSAADARCGGTCLVVGGITQQNSGVQIMLAKLNSSGVMISSGIVTNGDVGAWAFDGSGNMYHQMKLRSNSNGSSAFLIKRDKGLNQVAQSFVNAGNINDFKFSGGYLYEAAEGTSDGSVVRKVDLGTLSAVSTLTYTFPNTAQCFSGGSCGGNSANGQSVAIDPNGGSVYAAVNSGFSSVGRLWALVKVPAMANGNVYSNAQVNSADITGLNPNNNNLSMAVDGFHNVYLAFVPNGQVAPFIYAYTYKFNSSLQQVASARYGPIVSHFSGGIGNMVVDSSGTVYEAWEAPDGRAGNPGSWVIVHFDSNLNVVATQTFGESNAALEDFAFSIGIQDSSNVYVAGGVNNGRNLDWAVQSFNMNHGGNTAASAIAAPIAIANGISGNSKYTGVLATSGTVRVLLLPSGSNVPIRVSSAAFGANTSYVFNNVPSGAYQIQAFIDVNNDFHPDANDPYGQTSAGGFYFAGSTGSVALNVSLCDRRPIVLGQTITDAVTAADCTSSDSNGAYQRYYTFQGTAGQVVTIEADAINFYYDYVTLYDPNGNLVASDEGGAGNGNSRISNYKLQTTGLYTIGASPFASGVTGSFKLSFTGTGGVAGSLGSISGSVSYAGVQGGRFVVGLFSSPSFSSTTMTQAIAIPGPGSFSLANVQTGTTYYIGGFVDVNGDGLVETGKDIGFFGSTTTGPTAVYLRSGQSYPYAFFTVSPSTVSVAASTGMVSGSVFYNNCTANSTSLNKCVSNLRVEFWTSNTFVGQPIAASVLPGGATTYFSISLPSGLPYYIRAFLDVNNDATMDPGDPFGIYSAGGLGALPVQPVRGSIISNVNITLRDPSLSVAQNGSTSATGEGTVQISTGTAGATAASNIQVPEGTPLAFNIFYTAGPSGLQAGGKIQLVVPPGWPIPQSQPSTSQQCTINSGQGCISLSTAATGNAAFTALQTGVGAVFTITGGAQNPGAVSTFTYVANVPCGAGVTGASGVSASSVTVQTFSIASAQGTGVLATVVAPQPIFSGSPSLAVARGSARTFGLQNAYFNLKQNQVSNALTLQAFDACGSPAGSIGVSTTVLLSAETTSYNFANGSFLDDNSGAFGFAQSTAGPFVRQLPISLSASVSNAVFYASGTNIGPENIAVYSYLAAASTIYANVTVLPSNVLINVSVSTIPTQIGPTLATIIPNGDPTKPNQAYINFDLYNQAGQLDVAGQQGWHVEISSIPFQSKAFTGALWDAWGFGTPTRGQIAWDGRYNPWFNGGARVASGRYYIRISIGAGAAITDASSQILVQSPQLVGVISDANTTPPVGLSGVTVRAFGTFGGGSVQTDSQGNFTISGLSAGSYQLIAQKSNYLIGQAVVTLDSQGNVLAPVVPVSNIAVSTASNGVQATLSVLLSRAPTLAITPIILSTASTDQWGSLQVANASFTVVLNSGIHVAAGTTTFDDGGQWDPSAVNPNNPSGFGAYVIHTAFTFNVPADTYTVTANFPNVVPVSTMVYAAPGVTSLTLPAFAQLNSISGGVFLAPTFTNPNGVYVTVSAVSTVKSSTTIQSGFTSMTLPPATSSLTYVIPGIASGQYALAANGVDAVTGQSLGTVQIPPVTVSGSSLSGVNFPAFADPNQTNLISGTVTVTGSMAALQRLSDGSFLRLHASAWAQNSPNFGSTVVDISTWTTTSASGTFTITGLSSGVPVYQVFAYLESNSNNNQNFTNTGVVPALVPMSQNGKGNLALSYAASSGTVSVSITISSNDFSNVSLFGTTINSPQPQNIGHTFSIAVATTLPNFTCSDGYNNALASAGTCPTTKKAAFTVTGLNTETDSISFLYKTNGQNKTVTASIVSGSTFTVNVDLSQSSYSISGLIVDQVTVSTYNTNFNIYGNAPNQVNAAGAPSAWQLLDANGNNYSTSSARVVATYQDPTTFNVAISTVFRPNVDRTALLNPDGSFTILNVPPGVYFVHTENLLDPVSLTVSVPRVGQVVRVGNASVSGVNLTLSNGYSVSGAITLDNSLQDARTFLVTIYNGRQEVVRSTSVYLGDGGVGVLVANSVNYSISNLPAGQFYTLTVTDVQSPAKYVGVPIKFPDPTTAASGLQSNQIGQNVLLERGAFIVGRLQDLNTGAQISAVNAGLLAPSFQITATADPWVNGGFVVAASSVAGRPIQADGTFRVGPLLPGISYDLSLAQTQWNLAYLNNGSQNYAPVLIGGLTPTAGQTLDMGIIALNQGQSVVGAVTDLNGNGLGNLQISATPSYGSQQNMVVVQSFTNSQGNYTLWVSTSLASRFDITAAPTGGNQASNGNIYGSVTHFGVNLASNVPVNFTLAPLLGQVTGQIVTQDGGALSYPFGALEGFPAAAVFLQPSGVPPNPSSPLGSIQGQTDAVGNFTLPGLSTGAYILRAASIGYKVATASVAVTLSAGQPSFCIYQGTAVANCLQTLTLGRGATITGRILKTDPTSASGFVSVNQSEVGGIVAANRGFTKLVFGAVNIDPNAKTVNSYTLSGFDAGTGDIYNVGILSQANDDIFFPTEGSSVTFTASESTVTKNIDLTFVSSGAVCAANQKQIGTVASPSFLVQIVCNKGLRNKISLDSLLPSILTVSPVTSTGAVLTAPNGNGALAAPTNGVSAISSNRKVITAIYTPAAGETQFSLQLKANSSNINPATGIEFPINLTFDFFAGVDNKQESNVSNISGGGVQVQSTPSDDANGVQENTGVNFNAGSFVQTCSTCAPIGFVKVSVQRAQDSSQVTAQAIKTYGYVPSSVNTLTSQSALPLELAQAENSYHSLASNGGIPAAFSAFYRVFLPQGIIDQLTQPARITISYNVSGSTKAPATNVGDLNVWHFTNLTVCPDGTKPRNPSAGGGWCLEDRNRALDTVNRTISVDVDNFSSFVVFASTPILSVRSYTGAGIMAYNFPNPSDCIAHTFQVNASGTQGTQTLFAQGTMIKTSLPLGPGAQSLQIKIYDAAGELVRTIDQGTVPDGTFNYTPWDCKNDSGHTIASGVYFAVVKWANMSKVFKIAIVKGSGL